MNTIAIDTHKTIRKLKEKGYTEEQAEGFVEALTESELVTKSYLDTRLTDLKIEILKMMVVQSISIVGLTVALIELLK